jgi:cytochrome c oxidase assembly protein subunit 15
MSEVALAAHKGVLRTAEKEGTGKALRVYSKFVCASVLLLIFFGALVTSHDAGLAVPDWPTTYGENMFLYHPSKWVGPIFYEHFHRLLASGIGMLTVVLTVWILLAERRRWVKVLSVLALAAVIIQGLLGGLTVLMKLPDAVSVAHGMLAQTFFCLVIVIAYSQSLEYSERHTNVASGDKQLFRLALTAGAVVYLQLFFGAVMRHGEAGLALVDFPTFAGAWIPAFDAAMLESANALRKAVNLAPVTMYQVTWHSVHRIWAVVVTACVVYFAVRALSARVQDSKIRTIGGVLFVGILIQFTLGVLAVLFLRHPYIASIHVMVGALMLGLCVLAALRTYPMSRHES